MAKIFLKPKEKQESVTRYWFMFALFVIASMLFYVLRGHSLSNLQSENLIQATVMSYRLKLSLGLMALGGLASYALTYVFTHSGIGRWMVIWDDKDDSRTKAAKILCLGIVYGASLMGVFKLLANVIASS